MVRAFFRLGIFILLLSAVAASAQAKVYSSYKKNLKHATREDEVFQREDFYASFTWHATRLTPDFLQAWANEEAAIYNLNAEDKAAFLAGLQKKYAGYQVFFVSFYTYEFREADLSKSDSVWKLWRQDGDQHIEPVRLQKINRPNTYYKRLFPYIDTWSNCYFVFFPKDTGPSGRVSLTMAGPTGQGDLVWK